MVTPEMERENRVFEVIGTGHPINPCIRRDFIGTVQIPEMGLVFHVFEVVP